MMMIRFAFLFLLLLTTTSTVVQATTTTSQERQHATQIQQLQTNHLRHRYHVVDDDQRHRQLWNKDGDVIVVLDGGDSVDDDTFEAQKEALITAITNRDVVPRDGKFTLAVIQYGNVPEVSIGVTAVDSNQAVNQLRRDIRAMQKIGGASNMAAAVTLAADTFDPRYRARQVILLLTDELPEEDLEDAVEDAKESRWELDVMSVLCFDDEFTPDEFIAAYTNVLVDGQIGIASDQDEMAAWIAVAAFGYQGSDDSNDITNVFVPAPSPSQVVSPVAGPPSPARPYNGGTNYLPIVTMLEPADNGESYDWYQVITFQAAGFDVELGVLIDEEILWYLDGAYIGYGLELSYNAWWLAEGEHTVLVRGIDPITGFAGPAVEREFNVNYPGDTPGQVVDPVDDVNTPPEVTQIVKPQTGQVFRTDQRIKLKAEAEDEEDGELGGGASVQWYLNFDYSDAIATGGSAHIGRDTLDEGIYSLTAVAMDSRGAESDPVTVVIEVSNDVDEDDEVDDDDDDDAGTVTLGDTRIRRPRDQDEYGWLDEIYLKARYDEEEADYLAWFFYEEQGDVPTGGRVGNRLYINATVLGVGTHDIEAVAVRGSDMSSDVHTITVLPPVDEVDLQAPDIRRPRENERISLSSSVLLRANIDPTAELLLWIIYEEEDRDNLVYSAGGNSIRVPATTLGVGTYFIEAATTRGVQRTTDTVVMEIYDDGVPNLPPTLTIETPNLNDIFHTSQVIELFATSFDQEDGILDGDSLEWESDLNGELGEGQRVNVNAVDLLLGRHLISAFATDSDGDTVFRSVSIQITEGPIVSIASPGRGLVYQDTDIELQAVVSPGFGTGAIRNRDILWYSIYDNDVDTVQEIGQGGYELIHTDDLADGYHEIICIAENINGQLGVDSVFILVNEAPADVPAPVSARFPGPNLPRRNPPF